MTVMPRNPEVFEYASITLALKHKRQISPPTWYELMANVVAGLREVRTSNSIVIKAGLVSIGKCALTFGTVLSITSAKLDT